MKLVYPFSQDPPAPRSLVGLKGEGLAQLTRLGVRAPEGFTITAEACRARENGHWPDGLAQEVDAAVAALEEQTGLRLGDPERPLLLAVRAGAAVPMPGVLATILDVGLTAETEAALKRTLGERATAAARRRLEDGFADAGSEVPRDAHDQLVRAIDAACDSFTSTRARLYRRVHGIPDDLGAAVSVCRMVFRDADERSAAGVAFSRDPVTGEHAAYGEYERADGRSRPLPQLAEDLPDAHAELVRALQLLEEQQHDAVETEYAIERGTLYLLQVRPAERSAAAALRIARDLVSQGLIDEDEAVRRIDPRDLDQLLHPRIDPQARYEVLARGLNASPGAAVGEVVFDADTASQRGSAGEPVILVRFETTPDDVHGILAAQGILTAHGGMTSHAAVIARGMGKPCVTGVEGAQVDQDGRRLTIGRTTINEGDQLTIDGSTGEVILGALPLAASALGEDFEVVGEWADERRRLRVRANADTAEEAARARGFGAEGIGLCRTEHMFMARDRLPAMRQLILADDEDERAVALDRLLPVQQQDFCAIFTAMAGLPVTVRLLDPPLHEFLPDRTELALQLERLPRGGERDRIRRIADRVQSLTEQNPMLGTRGSRLGILHPDIYEMQVRAIVRGAQEAGRAAAPCEIEIMLPLVTWPGELSRLRQLVEETVADELQRSGGSLSFIVGTMIELPRACLRAGDLAAEAEFFSFGTNDLTQTVCGLSRDDAESNFLATYVQRGVVEQNPFATLDEEAVGEVIRIGCERGRAARPDLRLGVCGEHGADPPSVRFFHRHGLDYVSCSPYRVPVARLAAAQAALQEGQPALTGR